MARLNNTIDNNDPLITYNGNWIEGSKSNDPYYDRYSNGGTFTLTTTNGDSASFTFNGTGVWIFGAKRGNHGPYKVVLDNVLTSGDGFSPDPGLFQTPLFSAPDLTDGLHTVTITNLETDSNAPYLDIDFITWESERADQANVADIVFEDTDSKFTYQPASAWNTNPASVGQFSGGTGHSSAVNGSTATFSFKGNTVSIYGTIGPTNAPYSVQLDDSKPRTFNATKQDFVTQKLLYYADGLGSSDHTLKLTNLPSSSGQTLNLDFAVVNTTPGGTNSGSASVAKPASTASSDYPTANSSTRSSGHSNGLSSGAVAGIIVGVLFLLGALGALFFFIRRRRKNVTPTVEEDRFEQVQPPAYETTMSSDDAQIRPYSLGAAHRPPPSEVSTGYEGLTSTSQTSQSEAMYPVRSLPSPPLTTTTSFLANLTYPQYRRNEKGSGDPVVLSPPPHIVNRVTPTSSTDQLGSSDHGSQR